MESSTVPISWPSAQVIEEMPTFNMPSALKIVGCMANGDTTPPSSPVETSSPHAKSPLSARLKLNNFIAKHHGSAKSANKLRRNRTLHHYTIATIDHGTPNKPVATRIETPYPLVLPESPISMEDGSDRHSCHLPQLELRRVMSSYQDLRAAAQVQEHHLNLPSRSHPQTPLLPSPIIDERMTKTTAAPQSYFKIGQDASFATKRRDRTYKSYEDLHILSCYDDDHAVSRDDLTRHKPLETVSGGNHGNSHNAVSSSSSPTSTRHSAASSSSSVDSPESGWLANTTSHNERQQRFKARCYQVVQHSFEAKKPAQESDEKIMLATVLVGRRKPKIVQIQRPPSSNNSVRSKGSLATRHAHSPPIPESSGHPTTPMYQRKEISAFSPYDTPSNFTPFTDLSYTACSSARPKIHQPIYSDSKIDLIPMPLSTSRVVSSVHKELAMSDDEASVSPDVDPFEMSDEDIYDAHMWLSRSMTNSKNWTRSCTRSQTQPSPTENTASQSKHRRLSRNISLITKAIDEFPSAMLRLDSPLVLGLRTCPTSQADKDLINALKVVFPTAPTPLLSALAAWVIVDSYFSNLDDYRPSTISIGRTFSQRMLSISTSRYAQPDPKSSLPTSGHQNRKERPPSLSVPLNYDESLHSIPSKARNVLGIDNEMNIRLLLNQAKVLQASIGVVSQRLLELVRSDGGGWDPALWRAITMIVKHIEGSDSSDLSSKHNDVDKAGPTVVHQEESTRDVIGAEKSLGSNGDYSLGMRDVRNWV